MSNTTQSIDDTVVALREKAKIYKSEIQKNRRLLRKTMQELQEVCDKHGIKLIVEAKGGTD